MKVERAKKKDFPELMDMMFRAFAASRPDIERFEVSFPDLYRPTADSMEHMFVIRSGTQIASTGGAFPIHLAIGPVRLQIAGIGGICTLPEHRGKGGMTSLLTYMLDVLRTQDYPLAWLSGLRRRYRRFGFERAGSAISLEIREMPPVAQELGWTIRRVEPDSATLDAIYKMRADLLCRGLTDDVTYQLKLLRKHHEVWMASLGMQQAYVVLNRRGPWLVEWGGAPEGVRELATYIAQTCQGYYVRIPPVRDIYTDIWLDLGEQFNGAQDCLAVLNPTRLLKSYQSWLAGRWPRGKSLVVKVVDRGEMSFVISEGRVARRAPSDATVIELRAIDLPRLLFGPVSVDLLFSVSRETAWLREVFPLPFYMPGLWRV